MLIIPVVVGQIPLGSSVGPGSVLLVTVFKQKEIEERNSLK